MIIVIVHLLQRVETIRDSIKIYQDDPRLMEGWRVLGGRVRADGYRAVGCGRRRADIEFGPNL